MLPTEFPATVSEAAEAIRQNLEHAEPAEVAEVVEETPAQAKARRKAHNTEATNRLKFFARTATQGDWIAVCRLLDMTRPTIEGDTNLTLLAMAYIKEKRQHGAANMQLLLEWTDNQLLEFHGFDVTGVDDEDDDDQD